VLAAYNDSLRSVWYLALGLACSILLASFGMEWKNIKELKPKPEGGDAQEDAKIGF
jgi:hypothetical protein